MNADEQVEQVAREWIKDIETRSGKLYPLQTGAIISCARLHLAALDSKQKELEQLRLGVELLEKAVRNYEATNSTLTAKLKEVCEAGCRAIDILETGKPKIGLPELTTAIESAQHLITKGS